MRPLGCEAAAGQLADSPEGLLRAGAAGVEMTRRESFQQCLDRAGQQLDQFGQRVSAFYESASAVSGGVIPFRPVRPRILGSAAALAACLLSVVIVSGSYFTISGLIERLRSAPTAETPAQPEFVLRCAACGGDRCVGWTELGDTDSRDGSYWCETCRAYSAYRMDVGDACVALPLYEGDAP